MIILNNMYTGRYITKQGKLGHEIINLFKADDGKNYIWLNSMGVCSRKDVEHSTIVLVRCINSKLYKVLGKAENCELLPGVTISRSRKNKKTNDRGFENKPENERDESERYEAQKHLSITYNKKCPMDVIFDEKDMFATFKSESVYKTNCDVYLTNDETLKNEDNHVYCLKFKIGESMRHYIKDNDRINDLQNNLLNNRDIWEEVSKNDIKSKVNKPEFNFLKLIKKDKDELSISNILAYFIDKVGIKPFLKGCLELEDEKFFKDDYELLREKHNIDISFFGKEHVVIIENKIDADITVDNKKKKDKFLTQVKDAVEKYFEESKWDDVKIQINNFVGDKGDVSQLSKYYIYAIAYLLSKGIDIKNIEDNIKCYLLIPEYSIGRFNANNEGYYKSNRNFRFEEKYKRITYKKVFDYFGKRKIKDKYFKDFISMLRPLSKEFNNEIEEEMKYRFFKAIGKI